MRKIIVPLVITLLLFYACGKKKQGMFTAIPASQSGVEFSNTITENDSINPIDLEFLYNSGGVSTGDFDRDGKPDLYFTGSQVSNKLYLNKGDYKFKDVTTEAKVTGDGKWCNSAAVVDINNDGWPDIYVCCTNSKNPQRRKNLLYINMGLDSNKVPVFKEMAAEYGLADTSYSVSAAFFDADNDGDLDMFLVTTLPVSRDIVQFNGNHPYLKEHKPKLFQCNWDAKLKHPVYTDISAKAGIKYDGYGLGVSIVDINHDGWKDIYVTNDFLGSDVLYINNHDGTFTNKISQYFKHTSANAMGNDFADINNDGLPDFITVDMDPELNSRKKQTSGANNYNTFMNLIDYGYMLQYPRNTLQINQGNTLGEKDSVGNPVFSETAYLAGVAETDWSWSALFADFDNDGYRDLMITNGYPRDVTDHDFAAFRRSAAPNTPKRQIIDQLPSVKLPNYAFRNRGNATFDDVTEKWGMKVPSFSVGALYADLDGTGKLDYVVSNINDQAFVYHNTVRNTKKATNYLKIRFKGGPQNINGIGAVATLYYDGNKIQAYDNSPYRGYLSTVPDIAFFGLGDVKKVDSVNIEWPGGKKQIIHNVQANQTLLVDINNATTTKIKPDAATYSGSLFADVTQSRNVNYLHYEQDRVDFDIQKLLPHKLSQYTPCLAVGDADGNGTDDIFIGNSNGGAGAFLLQDKDGKFKEKKLTEIDPKFDQRMENSGALLFDARNTGHDDLYLVSGSNEFEQGSKVYADRLYLNDGKGNFSLATDALPVDLRSKSCVKAADFNKDGKLDLFIGSRTIPDMYPKPASCKLLRNDSHGNTCKFSDVTASVAPFLKDIGMVTDAIWTDFDNDGWTDLVLVGEFMPVTFIRNDHGKFINLTTKSGVGNLSGCWNSIIGGDFTNSGRTDYIVGNFGLNSFYRVTADKPYTVYAKDFDQNGSYDAIPSVYLKDDDGQYQEFPAFSRDDMIKQMIGIRRKYPTYRSFGQAKLHDILSDEDLKGALVVKANTLSSYLLKNLGDGKFQAIPLPLEAQVAPLYGMVAGDFNNDGNLDVAITGNDYGIEVGTGRCDALNGLVLLGNGKGGFKPVSILNSGVYIPGDGKALVSLVGADGKYLLAASQNRGPLKLFAQRKISQAVHVKSDDVYALLHYPDGKIRKQEFYYGTSFASQSSRSLIVPVSVNQVEIVNNQGVKRNLPVTN